MSHELRTLPTHKLVLRTLSAAEALRAYQAHRTKGEPVILYSTPLKRKA